MFNERIYSLKFNLVNFKGLIGFIQPFVNWATSNLANREDPQKTIQGKRFRGQKGAGTRQCTGPKSVLVIIAKLLVLRG